MARLEELRKLKKKFIHLVRSRTRDLLVCGIVPQSSMLTRQDHNLPVVLYGCETWCLTLTEEHKLRMFENMVLRRMFGQKKEEVTGGWSKLHKEELRNLYS
jgi:hypothetical protein